MALQQIAAMFDEPEALFLGLDALGNRFEAKRLGKADDAFDDLAIT